MIENIYYLVIGLFLYNRYLFLEKSIMINYTIFNEEGR